MVKSTYSPKSGLFNSAGRFLMLNLIIVIALTFTQCPSCYTSWEGFLSILDNFIFSFLMSCSLSFGGQYVNLYYENKISWIAYPIRRLVLTATTYFIYTFIVSYVLIALYILISVDRITIDNMPWNIVAKNTMYAIGVAFIIITIFVTRSWLMEWKKAAIEAEQLKTEKIASRYQSLKDQLNPHFLFNSLNALSNLVYEDADKSAHFIQQLSKIYRYVLDVQQEELVSLDKELDFAKSYLSLQKIRFEDSLRYKIIVNGTQGYMLPPLSLQLLLENAVKHNIASMAIPLNIFIEQKGDSLWVCNDLQPKSGPLEDTTGVGLENINNRYELLSHRKPEILQENNQFIVKLPLLNLSQ
ncbi:sensor histidine kinase [Anditalea andensis]|nr:sensor histidine kinase [Anditalea andensis]